MSKVAVLYTQPETILEDYYRVMHLAGYLEVLSPQRDTLLKLNLSWTKFFPACSTPPWALEGALHTLLQDGFSRERLFPVENKTVVTNPWKGAENNGWLGVLKAYGVPFIALPEVEWIPFQPSEPLLILDKILPQGLEVPKMFPGKQVLHLPTVKTHGHSITTGAIKNAFGGLLKEYRHYGHKYIHETLVDLLLLQKSLHPGVFAVMDGTVAGNGAGPRTMEPQIKNILLASSDSVAIDAVSAKLMGFDPLSIPYLRMAYERGLGCADLREIEIVGEDISEVNWGFRTRKSLVIFGDQAIRKGFLRPLEKILLHSPLWVWAPIASTIYHDWFWYPLIGRPRVKEFTCTEWGRLFQQYRQKGALAAPPLEEAPAKRASSLN